MKKLHNHIFVSGQISADDFPALQQAGIKVIINNRPDGEEPGQLKAEDAARLAGEYGMNYHYLPMVNGQPIPDTLVEAFKSALESSGEPTLIHCRSGMRSSVLWAMGQIPAGNITVEEAISAAQAAGIPLNNARTLLESL